MRQQIISLGIIASLMVPWVQGRVRYMPFGDSITDYGCWRPWIEEKLKQEGLDVDFVGTRKAQAVCNNLPYDRDHEGHPGFHAHSIAKENQLVDWLRQNPADILTMHLSTVDIVLANRKTAEIIAAYSTLLDQMRAINPAMRIIVAQIIPIPSSAKAVQDLNKAIPAWASSKNTTASPIWVVDQWTGFNGNIDLYDGLHPSASGDVKIADKFYPALVEAIRSIPT